MDETHKWSCEYCTYSNWPVAKKCVMCSALRPQVFITSEGCRDIYEVASLSLNPQTTGCDHPAATASVATTWPCRKCTYINVSRSLKCSMCGAARNLRADDASAVTASQISGFSPPCVTVSGQDSSPSSQSNSQKNSPRSHVSPRSGDSTKEINNDKNRAHTAGIPSVQDKWLCPTCTYENFPKSQKCVLCRLPKPVCQENSMVAAAAVLDGQLTSAGMPIQADKRRPGGKELVAALKSPACSGVFSTAGSPAASELETISASAPDDVHSKLTELDHLWLNACAGIPTGDADSVEAYLGASGDPGRQLTVEEAVLLGAGRPSSSYESGYTLVHIAVRHGREDVLATLVRCNAMPTKKKKRLPPHVAPNLASDILRQVSLSLRQRKGDFPCYFLTECVTFALPVEMDDFVTAVQDQLFADILDQDVQKELEIEESIINWRVELADGDSSRLYALWNRTAGDCLLDSVLQATWGVFDRDNTLRHALADSLTEGAMTFYPRWKEYETLQQTQLYDYSLDEDQWQQDWADILTIASQPGSALEQMHIFALAHILRRPIIVYGVKYVKSFRGETIDLAKFQGVYLPLLWEANFCWKSPIALGYTRGHFSALVPMELDTSINTGAGARIDDDNSEQVIYLPLVDNEGSLLPLHFIARSQIGCEQAILRERLVCCHARGILCAEQALGRQPPLVKQMVDEWLHRYRRLSHAAAPHPRSTVDQLGNSMNARDYNKAGSGSTG